MDRSLSETSVTLTSLDGSGASLVRHVRDLALDRINVQLDIDVDINPDNAESLSQFWLQRAVQVANFYLEHYRTVARSPFVRKISRRWHPIEKRFAVNVPHTATWFDLENGSPLKVFNGFNAVLSSGAISSPETGFVAVAALRDSMAGGVEPPLSVALLVDAEAAVHVLSLREATLYMATAAEVAVKRYVSDRGEDSNPDVRSALKRAGESFAKRHLDLVPEILDGNTFSGENPAMFSLVEQMYRQRNDLMHGGAFGGDIESMSEADRQELVWSWLVATWSAVDWIASLLDSGESSSDDN
ncbi:hypothetical protein [Saccharothrix deserti]|uniref:hypothetical protein n=1 Tax=Saccharothrix deserti TaxID=2593674 RepID=UPI00131EB14A|nr:hypothetical protein [Saccharothrix deserti]